MPDMMTYPKKWEEFENLYGFKDTKELYTNGSRLIPSFRVEQWLDHLPHWIPCSERLPKEGEVVLTQAVFKDDIKMAVSSRQDYNYWTGWGTRDINIVAWMQLPAPYKRGEE